MTFSTHKCRHLYNCIVFVCINLTIRSIFNVFQWKFERKFEFGCIFQLVEHMMQLVVEEWVVEGWHGKFKNTVSFFFTLRVNDGIWLQEVSCSSILTSCMSSRKVSIWISSSEFHVDCFYIFLEHKSQRFPLNKFYSCKCFLARTFGCFLSRW